MSNKHIRNNVIATLLALLWCSTAAQALAQTGAANASLVRGRVVAVADGDTITVLDAAKRQHKIRFQGIDAPERTQAYGTRARQALSDLIFGKDVEVRIDKRDRYGRSVSVVRLDGADINLALIRAGMGWHYKQYEREQSAQERTAYATAEAEAREAKRGLWADAQPTPPWEYRRTTRDGGAGARPPAARSVAARSGTATNASPALLPPALGRDYGSPAGAIIGNRNSKIYHLPNCPNYADVSSQNRVAFSSREEAERAGYRRARNCPN